MALAVESLAALATLPYRRGAEVQAIALGPEVAGWTTVPAYDFREYRARWGGDPPAPRYVLAPTFATGREPVAVEVELDRGGAPAVVSLTLPAGSPAGLSFAVPLADDDGPALRVRRLRTPGMVPPGPPAARWVLLALLGNFAKLLWVTGRELDELAAAGAELLRQRHLGDASGMSLDLHGRSLRVPRFPAREHSFDPDTRALFHFQEHPVPGGGNFADETARFGLPGHPATSQGPVSGGAGKFGRGLALPGPSGSGHLTLANDADFNLPLDRGFTVELFVQLEPEAAPRALVVKGTLDAPGDLTGAGWALTAGSFRGVANNPRWQLRAGAADLSLYADLDLADGRFHHLAATVDRGRARALLFVDGIERANADLAALPAVANAQLVRVGRSTVGHQATALVDELRFSSVARTDFHPVLGEGDGSYRRRLAIFRRWLLPSLPELAAALNSAVSIGGDPAPLVLVERDRPLAKAVATVRLVPGSLPPGTGLDAEGNPRGSVEEACGRVEDEPGFLPALLLRHDAAGAAYADEAARRMQAGAAAALDRLLARLAAVPGQLRVEAAFDPAGEGLSRVGRALLLSHPNLPAGELAALAHRAGFAWVEHRPGRAFAAVPPGHRLVVEVAPPPPVERPAVADVFAGRRLELSLSPDLPEVTRFEWSLIPCGKGRARFESHPADVALRTPVRNRRRLHLVAETPGEVAVAVEARLSGVSASGARTFRIAPQALAGGEHVAADGDLEIAEAEALAPPPAAFDPTYLVVHASGVGFGPDPDARRMGVALDRTLEHLAELLGPARAQLTVTRAFTAGTPDLHGAGRALRMQHAAIPADALASLAHQAGFGWVLRDAGEVYASVEAADPIEIVRAADGRPLPEELVLETPLDLTVRPDPLPAGTLNWSVDSLGFAAARLRTALAPDTTVTPTAAGGAAITFFHLGVDPAATAPFTFEVRLSPALEAAGTLVPKPEYDLVMNLLHHFHPLGVEISTRRLRERVVEVRDNLLNAFPGYTYPDFRA